MRGLRDAGLQRAIILVDAGNSLGREFWLRNGWEDIASARHARDIFEGTLVTALRPGGRLPRRGGCRR